MAKKQDGYLSAKESRRISKENRRITDQYEKKRKRRNVPEIEYTVQMHPPTEKHRLFSPVNRCAPRQGRVASVVPLTTFGTL